MFLVFKVWVPFLSANQQSQSSSQKIMEDKPIKLKGLQVHTSTTMSTKVVQIIIETNMT